MAVSVKRYNLHHMWQHPIDAQHVDSQWVNITVRTEVKRKGAQTDEQNPGELPSGVYSTQKLLSIAVLGDEGCKCGLGKGEASAAVAVL